MAKGNVAVIGYGVVGSGTVELFEKNLESIKQKIGRETLRYCGTPLKYSFSEKDHKKSITVIDLKSKDEIEISEIPLKPLHDMREIRGTYDELMKKGGFFAELAKRQQA